MINYKYKDLFGKDHVDKQLKIATDDGKFTALNADINWENFELTESLCSDSELHFGNCEPSMVKFQIRNAFIPLAGKWITITETLNGNTDTPFQYGRYKVFSDVPTADREYRDITAYDAMYDIIGTDVAAWYNTILPNKDSTVTLKQFRESFVRYFELTEVVPEGGLVNDDMVVEKTIEVTASSETENVSTIGEAISGKDVIQAICEINGCFGHIGRDGKFYYIYLPQSIQGLYPADDLYPSNTLYPSDPKGSVLAGGTYIDIKYEDFLTESIAKLQIRQGENEIGKIWPETSLTASDNCYIIQGNFLVYGKSSEQLKTIAENIYGKITGVIYIPLENCTAMGNPCFEAGDAIRMNTKYKLIETYILKRTLKGIQSLRDTYEANGVKKYAEKVNGVHQSIMQLKGKSNTLERTIEMTRLEMKDMGEGLSTEIKVTAAGLRAETAQTYETKSNAGQEYTSIKSSISLESGRISSEIERATKSEQTLSGQIVSTNATLSSKIEQTEQSIISTVSATYETKSNAGQEYTSIKSSIHQNANSITAEVSRASAAEGNLSSRVSLTESGLTSKVSKGDLSSEISQEAGKISLKSNRISIESTNFTLSENGEVEAKALKITGGSINISTSSESYDVIKLWRSGGYCGMDSYGIAVNDTSIGTTTIGASGVSVTKSGNRTEVGHYSVSVSGSNGKTYIDDWGIHTNGLYSSTLNGTIVLKDKMQCNADINVGAAYSLKFNMDVISLHSSSAKFFGSEFNLNSVKLGKSNSQLGFFGDSGSARRTVKKIYNTTNVSTVSDKVDELIDALAEYGLISK